MLTCCNEAFKPVFSYVLNTSKLYYRRIEFGTCPTCGGSIFRDYIQFEDGSEIVKDYSGKVAKDKFNKWQNKLSEIKYCSFANQNVYYGDFKKSGRKFIQLRKNFNNQSEVLGEVETKVFYG